MPVGIIVLSLDLKIILFNNLFQDKFNVRTKHQIKSLMESLKYSPGRRDYFERENEEYLMKDIKRYIQNLSNPPTTFGIVERNGYYYEWRGNMTLWEDFHAIILTARNVTSFIQLEKSRAEAACKNAMLRSVSHELRTPTAIISSSAEQIVEDVDSNLTESSKESLNMINVCSKILLNIIHDLIDFSQIISGQFNIVRMKFSIQDLLNECIFLVSTQCRKKNLSLNLVLDPRLPPFAVNDANRIRQVILNLMSNALKFTFQGKIVLSAKLRSSNQVKISVYDTGTGISRDSLQKIFKLFSDMNDGFIESHGCGLGLHISSLIVQKLGGNITVKSTPNIGSKFSFLFDLGMIYETDSECESDFYRVPSEAETSSLINIPTMLVKLSQRGKPTPILIADDNEFNRKILCNFFDKENLRYDEACNGVQAVEMTRKKNKSYNSYRVIIMDCQMPKMDGWTASKTIHDLFHNQEIKYLPKIIGYTAYTGTEEFEKCMSSGMVDCLYKPTSRDNLLRVVRLYLDLE
jgi:signal transduction histidine kinase/CheY-like chemotaxis protein